MTTEENLEQDIKEWIRTEIASGRRVHPEILTDDTFEKFVDEIAGYKNPMKMYLPKNLNYEI